MRPRREVDVGPIERDGLANTQPGADERRNQWWILRAMFAVVLVAVMALGSLALWTAIPAAWLWLTRDVGTDGARYFIVLTGCAITMLLGAGLLYRLEAVYAGIKGAQKKHVPAHSPWLRSVSDERRPRGRLTLLEVFLVVSAVVALVALVTWWAFLADTLNPSGPTAPGTEHGA